MDNTSRLTLQGIEQNNVNITKLWLGGNGRDYCGRSPNSHWKFASGDISQLGAAISKNTRLETLVVGDHTLVENEKGFYDGLECNSSIKRLSIYCNSNSSNILGMCYHKNDIVGGIGQEMLNIYQGNQNLIGLSLENANLQNGGDLILATTLRSCTNLKRLSLCRNNMLDGQLLPIVEAIRSLHSLEVLGLVDNKIGDVGCTAISTLFEDSSCIINLLNITFNNIKDEGAISLVNSLANNTKLKVLYFHNNKIASYGSIKESLRIHLSRLLCNTASINDIYLSNHTLQTLELTGHRFNSLLKMNAETNKSHVAIKKILQYHPNIDVSKLLELDSEEVEEEENIKILPHVIAWLGNAAEVVDTEKSNLLSVLYLFAKARPLMLVPAL